MSCRNLRRGPHTGVVPGGGLVFRPTALQYPAVSEHRMSGGGSGGIFRIATIVGKNKRDHITMNLSIVAIGICNTAFVGANNLHFIILRIGPIPVVSVMFPICLFQCSSGFIFIIKATKNNMLKS